MSRESVGMLSLSLAVPKTVRNNDYWRRVQPELIGNAEKRSLASLWERPPDDAPGYNFAVAMEPYLKDPFRGGKDRRVLVAGETTVGLEVTAARQALDALKMRPEDVEAMLVASFTPDPSFGVGDAVWIAQELGLKGAAWNLESACSGALIAYKTAAALVRAGDYNNVLVIVSCTYSRNMDANDTLSLLAGDAATAFVVGKVPEGEGVLGSKTVHTAATIGSLYFAMENEPNDGRPVRLRAHKAAGRLLRETGEGYLRCCAEGAMKAAGVTVDEIDFFAIATPNAWYPAFAARVLGFPMSKTINMHEAYSNIGPVLMPSNLFHAALEGRIKKGDLVLLYTVGSISSSGAMVVRWGDVKLGSAPEPGIPEAA